jgi:hypothetical protein
MSPFRHFAILDEKHAFEVKKSTLFCISPSQTRHFFFFVKKTRLSPPENHRIFVVFENRQKSRKSTKFRPTTRPPDPGFLTPIFWYLRSKYAVFGHFYPHMGGWNFRVLHRYTILCKNRVFL